MADPVIVSGDDRVVRVRLNRPDVRNALDANLIAQLTRIFRGFEDRASIRAVVLEGEGPIFCGGADINYMKAALGLNESQNYEDALRLSDMFAAIDNCPAPTVARVQGAALGGGA